MTFKELSKQFDDVSQYLMFCYILSKQGDDGISCIKLRDMEAETGFSIRKIRSFISSLEEVAKDHVCNKSGNNGGNFVIIDNQLLKGLSETMAITKTITMKIASEGTAENKKSKQSAFAKRKTPEDIKRRQNEFYATLQPYIGQYGQELIDRFYTYWAEPNYKTGYLLYEMKPTWDLSGRLATFGANSRYSSFPVQQEEKKEDPYVDLYEKFNKYITDNGLGRFVSNFSLDKFKNIRSKYSSAKMIEVLKKLEEIGWHGTDIETAFDRYGEA